MQHYRAAELLERCRGLVVGSARMPDHRRPELRCKAKLVGEEAALCLSWSVVAVEVEADLADRNDLAGGKRGELLDGFAVCCLVRMHACGDGDALFTLRQRQRHAG